MSELKDELDTYLIKMIGDNNIGNIIFNSINSSITYNGVVFTESISYEQVLNLEGVDLDGYLVSASGEAFNFKQMYNSVLNKFDTSGVDVLKYFNTDASFGRFNFSLTNPPNVLYLELTGGFDIFRLNDLGEPKENKNVFSRIVLNRNNDISNLAVTPVTSMISDIFIKMCEKDISINNTSISELSFNSILNLAEERVINILGPDFSGVSSSFLNKDPYDEIEYAIEVSDNLRLKEAKELLNANMKIFTILNNICDDYDSSINGYNKEKNKKYRRKCMKKFFEKRNKHYEEDNNKHFDESLATDDDVRSIEREAASEIDGIEYTEISGNRKTNDEFIKKMARKFEEEKEKLENENVDSQTYIEKLNDMDKIFEEFKSENDANGRKKSKPRKSDDIPQGEPDDYDKSITDKKDDFKNNPKPKPTQGYKPSRKW